MAIENDDIERIKGIVKDSLDESGITEAMEKLNQPPRMTKEQILAVKSPRERQKLISENMDLFQDSLH